MCHNFYAKCARREKTKKKPNEKKENFNLKQLNFASDLKRPGDRSIKIKL